MGAYLSQPITDKYSSDETLAHLTYGASSMQGWRATQEDAHNCIPNFETHTSLFAVYDGHGGAEVAQYCAVHLPDYIKSIPAFKAGNMAQALEDAFLGFDETLMHSEVKDELKQMAGILVDQPSDAEENEVNHLFAEANMPLEEVLAKYNSGTNPLLSHIQEEKPQSPFLRGKCSLDEEECKKVDDVLAKKGLKIIPTSLSRVTEDLCNVDKDSVSRENEIINGDKSGLEMDSLAEDASSKQDNDAKLNRENTRVKTDDSSETKTQNIPVEDSSKSQISDCGNKSVNVSSKDSNATVMECSVSRQEAKPGCSHESNPGTSLGKRPSKSRGMTMTDDSDGSSNSEDETYEEGIPYADTESDEGENEEGEGVEKEENSDEDNDEESEDDDDDDNDEEDDILGASDKEEPGADSGCTAVIALLRGNDLYVANAGDSRCIVCRNGKAIDMSVDHKPEDELEMRRIVNAGGKVTADGRVNGGLNLSRAIGDHTYKQNKDMTAKDQMISALPDIRTLTIDSEEDEFMVLACDGIWNYMSSQEVTDFVKERLNRGVKKLSLICEELFDHCLAPHTGGDGTGCDNMTAIIVKFHPELANLPSVKRSLGKDKINVSQEHGDEEKSKRAKLDENNGGEMNHQPITLPTE